MNVLSQADDSVGSKCINCGALVSSEAKFCGECGALQAASPTNSSEQVGVGLPESTVRKASRQKKLIVFFGITAVTVVIASASIVWFRSHPISPKAQYNLGVAYENGKGVPKDESVAASWFRKSSEQGYAAAEYELGVMFENGRGGLTKDDAEALSWCLKAAEQGFAKAQTNLGMMYESGRGVPQDDAQAVSWYRKAAGQGEAHAQASLGVAYEFGQIGLMKDDAEAVSWYQKSAEQGNSAAQANLGFMYKSGRGGLTKDDAQAVSWLRKAAEQGSSFGQYELGLAYDTGQGVEQDDVQAVSWFRKAANQDIPDAEYWLGMMYESGRGVPQDDAQAVSWYRKAAGHGFTPANDALSHELSSMEVQKPHMEIKGTPIDFISLYAKAHSSGLEIGKRYQVNAYVNSELTVLHPNESMGTEIMYMEHDFDDPSQIEAAIQKAVSSGRSLYCTVTVSRNGRFIPLYIHRAEDCH